MHNTRKRASPIAVASAIAMGIAGLPAGSAHAQTIFRCGDSYSSIPWAGGHAVQASDPRSAEQQLQADQASRRDAKLADTLVQSRLRQEAQSERKRSSTARPPAHARKDALDDWDDLDLAETAEPRMFTAREPAKPRPARQARTKPNADAARR